MKEQAILKINKVGKISAIVATICKVLAIVGMVICLAGTIICLVLPKDLVKVTTLETVTTEVNYEALGIEVPQEKVEGVEELQDWMLQGYDVQVEVVQHGVVSGSMTVTSNGQTFTPTEISIEDGVVKTVMDSGNATATLRSVAGLMGVAMVALAMTIVTLTFVEGLCKAFRDCTSPFEENVIKKMQRLAYALIPWTIVSSLAESILTGAVTNSFQWSFSLDVGVVLVVLIVLILVYIFKYGAVLQQESDETL